MGESLRVRVLIKVDVVDNVGALVAPVSDDGLPTELISDYLLVVVVGLCVLLELANPPETGGCAHKLEHIVDHERQPHIGVHSGCLEARPHLDVPEHKRVRDVEEARRTTNLLEPTSFTESLLNDDVQQGLLHVIVSILPLFVSSERHVADGGYIDGDFKLLLLVNNGEFERLI